MNLCEAFRARRVWYPNNNCSSSCYKSSVLCRHFYDFLLVFAKISLLAHESKKGSLILFAFCTTVQTGSDVKEVSVVRCAHGLLLRHISIATEA